MCWWHARGKQRWWGMCCDNSCGKHAVMVYGKKGDVRNMSMPMQKWARSSARPEHRLLGLAPPTACMPAGAYRQKLLLQHKRMGSRGSAPADHLLPPSRSPAVVKGYTL